MRINIVYDNINSGRWPLFYKTGNVPGFAILYTNKREN